MTPTQAAHNNALWCSAVCRAHGHAGAFLPGRWQSTNPTPRFYPDIVTLDAAIGSAPIIALRQARETPISVKDSFATLDLAEASFTILFEAQWISSLPAEVPADPTWHRIANAAGLAVWEQAWAGDTPGPRIFLPSLLDDPDIAIMACIHDGSIAGGGILNRGAGVVGLSNSFAPSMPADTVRHGLIQAAARHFPGLGLVGYARGEALASARRAGFTPIGGLRVWVSDIVLR